MITNDHDHRVYVGQSMNIERRFYEHQFESQKSIPFDRWVMQHPNAKLTLSLICQSKSIDDAQHGEVKLKRIARDWYVGQRCCLERCIRAWLNHHEKRMIAHFKKQGYHLFNVTEGGDYVFECNCSS
jgi:predicted GIY-YIG superfamily endonuclease